MNDGADAGGDPAPITLELPDTTITLDSTSGCLIDVDCVAGRFCFQGACVYECGADASCLEGEACSARGRCERPAGKSLDDASEAATPDVVLGVEIIDGPPSIIEIPPGAATATITLETRGAVPGGRILYRAELQGLEPDPRVTRAEGETTFTLTIPTGRADPEGEDVGAQPVNLVTSLGAFSFDLIPTLPFSGTYMGEVTLDMFGSVGLPFEAQIITAPPTASLEEAERAWAVLPVEHHRVFSPHERFDDETTFVTRALEYDDFLRRWVAVYSHEYRFGEGTVFEQATPGQLRRVIRLEIEPGPQPRTLIGQISDRWTGFYDQRSADGVVTRANVVFEGSLELMRVGAALAEAEVTPPVELPPPDPQLQPLPPLDACEGLDLQVGEIDVDGAQVSCEAISTLADFIDAEDAAAQARCAIAVAEAALQGETTADQIIAFLDDSTEAPGGMSFSEFMAACAAGDEGYCVPSPEVLCGRQLLAYAYARQDDELAEAAQIVTSYQSVTREAFLGRQLAAFQTDSDMRLTWLRTSDYPAIVTRAVQELNARLLEEWRANVLDVHMSVLEGQFDASGLAILSRTPTSEASQAAREQLLLEMQQTWRGAMEALTLVAQRWHTLYQADGDRAEAAAYVQQRMFDLYILAGIQSQLNREAGAGFANAAFGAGFSALMRELEQLSLPFSELIYARDGEVVISTSLDPTLDNDTLLGERERDALGALEGAAEAVGAIIADADQDALDAARIRNWTTNRISALRDELIELCGLPDGCAAEDVGVLPECEIVTEAGYCGFVMGADGEHASFDSGGYSVSEAGRAVLDYRQSVLGYHAAVEDYRAHTSRVAVALETTDAFARSVQSWNEQRRAALDEARRRREALRVIEGAAMERVIASIQAQQDAREAAYQTQAQQVAGWSMIRYNGVDQDFQSLVAVTALRRSGETLRATASSIDTVANITANGLPKVVGPSSDISGPARMAIRMGAWGTTSGIRLVAQGTDIAADRVANVSQREQWMRQAELAALSDLAALGAQASSTNIAAIQADIDELNLRTEAEAVVVNDIINALKANLELDLAHERDLVELRDRRDEVFAMMSASLGLELQQLQAELTVHQSLLEYNRVVQKAQLVAGRLAEHRAQQENLNQLLGSPSMVFAWANRLAQAEARLERAKDALMDWLIALEYFAVRPFMDQRLQILLARNTYQLEAIAEELRRLQRSCGGAINREVTTLSLRDDLLQIGFSGVNPDDNAIFTPGARLRAVLERGAVPIDKRTRYTADEDIGELLNRRAVWAATFNLDLDDFANLAATCNAKVASIAVQLVGEGLGDARPTVSVLYDGASQLRSCQPGLKEYLAQFGPAATAFGPITTFRTAGRSAAPVAGVNAFNDVGTENTSLSGLPLASQYTVIIDPELGENRDVRWGALEDILLRVEYAYQDPFPVGQCD